MAAKLYPAHYSDLTVNPTCASFWLDLYVSHTLRLHPWNQLYEYFTSDGLLYESQYGFRKLHSTELAALEFTDINSQEMDAKRFHSSYF